MSDFKVLGNNVLVRIVHVEESAIIEMANEAKRVNRFSKIIGVGPDVKKFKLGDEVLIPDKDNRVLFPSDGKEYCVFEEDTIRIKRNSF